MSNQIKICTYNIHKGLSSFNKKLVIRELRAALKRVGPDVCFLQEVQGQHKERAQQLPDWPKEEQHQFLAHGLGCRAIYGDNVHYRSGHHGNAILSRFPIEKIGNQDITDHSFEPRGVLHGKLAIPTMNTPVHLFCLHLSLFHSSRRKQLEELKQYILNNSNPHEPLIIAGDFNDWSGDVLSFADRLGLDEAFCSVHGQSAKTFPASLPLLRLDRIYCRGFDIFDAQVLGDGKWSRLSDHLPIVAKLRPRAQYIKAETRRLALVVNG